MEDEIWKDVEGYEGRYFVSNFGRAKSITHRWGSPKEKILKTTGRKQRYINVGFTLDGETKSYILHVLIAKAFVPNLDNKPYVNHKDLNKHNNLPSNLEWVTPGENNQHGLKNGVYDVFYTPKCKRNRFTEEQVLDMLRMHSEKVEISEIAKKHNSSKSTIWGIVKGIRWPHVYKKFHNLTQELLDDPRSKIYN